MGDEKRTAAPPPIVTLDDLRPDNLNPRVMPDANRKRLEAVMEEYGDLANITYNRRLGKLVGGHQRLRSLRARYGDDKLSLVPVRGTRDYRLRVDKGDGKFTSYPVRVVSWDEGRHRAAMVAANSPDVTGMYDEPALFSLLSEGAEGGFMAPLEDVSALSSVLGMSEKRLEGILDAHGAEHKGITPSEEFPDVNEKTEHTCPKCGYEY